ncbi:hypothetical protein [Cerasicoccus arenae]|uniref:Transposase n=1 Tax=Cerasicoccus arenae TaxID=424488 RepID=A0A8J3GEE6_9BACT|nr:hypothetical protein [Cerasicoccus arenae]MBK1859238.1 hypothetical protein [Cerasicoccus arenae]GHC02784.1 hypothetical protein GCM10007047_19330 [Cerasicoccus arenae]
MRREGRRAPRRTSIYSFIQADRQRGGHLYLQLRINGKRRYRYRNKANRSKLPARVGIGKWPPVVDRRDRYGDWEADLIAGYRGGGHLFSIYERKGRFGRFGQAVEQGCHCAAQAIIAVLQG